MPEVRAIFRIGTSFIQELQMAIKLMVADDSEVIRKGLARLLHGEGVQIIAEAVTGTEAIKKAKKLKPDVLLMDVIMPKIDGLDALEKIRQQVPGTKVIIMSAHDNPSYLARAVALGADDFFLKDVPAKLITASIKGAASGKKPAADLPFGRMKAELIKRPDPKADDVPLTKREYQVLRNLAYGLANREIGKSLGISVETVKEHIQNILRKLDVPDRTRAAVWAMERKLI